MIQLAFAAASMGASMLAGSKAADAQREQQRIQRAQENVSAIRQRRQLFREQRVRRAQLTQQSIATGTSGSSGEIGALGMLDANVASQVASQSMFTNTADAITASARTAANYQQQAGIYGQIGSTMFSLATESGETSRLFKGIKTIFSQE